MSEEPTKEEHMARYRIAFVAILALMTIPLVAFAGGWAIASFDEVPGEFEAGVTYDLEYTVLQHGETPVDVDSTEVRILDANGTVNVFQAVPTGQPGRYSVAVTFPESGTWNWEVTLGVFEAHEMGTVEVAAAAAAVAPDSGSMLRWVLPAALILVMGLVAVQVAELAKNRRTTGTRRASRPVRAD
jgi:hypothetical protein